MKKAMLAIALVCSLVCYLNAQPQNSDRPVTNTELSRIFSSGQTFSNTTHSTKSATRGSDISIGDWDDYLLESLLPFATWENSLFQTIYTADEIGNIDDAYILQVIYRKNVGSFPLDYPVKIYIAHTDKDVFTYCEIEDSVDWVPFEDFTLVFAGKMNIFGLGQNQDIIFPFNTPFKYNGGNIAIMTYKPFYDDWFTSNYWHASLVPDQLRTIGNFSCCDVYDPEIGYPDEVLGGDVIINIRLHVVTGDLGSVSGTVQSAGQPIYYATVVLDGTERTVYTDIDGNYTMVNVEVGTISLMASMFMYNPSTKSDIVVSVGAISTVDFDLIAIQHDLNALSISGFGFPTVDIPTTFYAEIRNDGFSIAEDFTVNLMQYIDGENDILLESVFVNSILPTDIETVEIVWIPLTDERIMVYAYIDFPMDENPTNDKSNLKTLIIQPKGTETVYIKESGNPNPSTQTPFSYHWPSSLTQTIYTQAEIGLSGRLTGFVWNFIGYGDVASEIPITVWVAETDIKCFETNDWVPFEAFTEVHFAPLPAHIRGPRDFYIEIDPPFDYTGGSLVIMTLRPFIESKGWYMHLNMFEASYITDRVPTKEVLSFFPIDHPSFGYPPGEDFVLQPWITLFFDTSEVSEYGTELPLMVTQLNANFPNPFNPVTTIAFDVAKDTNVKIDIYNIKGQRVTTLINEHFSVGSHRILWEGTDNRGRSVSSGIYFYKMTAGEFTQTRKMLLMK
jgi:hypothetical protein